MKESLISVLEQMDAAILGKEAQTRRALACLLANGHLLIEDIPGVGKTTLAHALARSLGMAFNRIQFTSDLLPADILGVTIYDRNSGEFRFHPGPIFAQVILADEINRASPKAQSALLESMEERQVSIEGETRLLPRPFFVIATQNPTEQIGVFPLPESQMDRFLMRLRLGYPGRGPERELLRGQDRRSLVESLTPAMTPESFSTHQERVRRIRVSEALLDYIQLIIDSSRHDGHFVTGLSPRGGLAIKHSAQAWAYLDGRHFVEPEDVQAILPAVVDHRLSPVSGTRLTGDAPPSQWLLRLPIP